MDMQQFCFGLAKVSYLSLMACKDVIFIMFIKWKLIPIGRSQYYKLYCLIISLAILKNIWFYNKLSCKHCVHIPTHLQAFINVLLTSLQELYKITVFHNLFSSLQHIFPRHSLLTNGKIFMCRFQYCNWFWVKSESHWRPAICILNFIKLYLYNLWYHTFSEFWWHKTWSF